MRIKKNENKNIGTKKKKKKKNFVKYKVYFFCLG